MKDKNKEIRRISGWGKVYISNDMVETTHKWMFSGEAQPHGSEKERAENGPDAPNST